jgi:hypothetical protein
VRRNRIFWIISIFILILTIYFLFKPCDPGVYFLIICIGFLFQILSAMLVNHIKNYFPALIVNFALSFLILIMIILTSGSLPQPMRIGLKIQFINPEHLPIQNIQVQILKMDGTIMEDFTTQQKTFISDNEGRIRIWKLLMPRENKIIVLKIISLENIYYKTIALDCFPQFKKDKMIDLHELVVKEEFLKVSVEKFSEGEYFMKKSKR